VLERRRTPRVIASGDNGSSIRFDSKEKAMESEQQDLSLSEDDAENILGGRAVAKTSTKKATSHPGYVPGETGVVNPASSGMAGDASGSDGSDDC
jgi:hypothetical protein